MIYVRDDDVLVPSSSHTDPEGRFRGVHNIIVKHGALHRPGILVTEIQQFPDTLEFCKRETATGRMSPQFHGLRHIDYGKLSEEEITGHLKMAQRVFMHWFGVEFKRFYTPWGARAPQIQRACDEVGVLMVDCKTDYHPARNIRRDPDACYEKYNEKEIMIHWWEGVGKLVEALKRVKQ